MVLPGLLSGIWQLHVPVVVFLFPKCNVAFIQKMAPLNGVMEVHLLLIHEMYDPESLIYILRFLSKKMPWSEIFILKYSGRIS